MSSASLRACRSASDSSSSQTKSPEALSFSLGSAISSSSAASAVGGGGRAHFGVFFGSGWVVVGVGWIILEVVEAQVFGLEVDLLDGFSLDVRLAVELVDFLCGVKLICHDFDVVGRFARRCFLRAAATGLRLDGSTLGRSAGLGCSVGTGLGGFRRRFSGSRDCLRRGLRGCLAGPSGGGGAIGGLGRRSFCPGGVGGLGGGALHRLLGRRSCFGRCHVNPFGRTHFRCSGHAQPENIGYVRCWRRLSVWIFAALVRAAAGDHCNDSAAIPRPEHANSVRHVASRRHRRADDSGGVLQGGGDHRSAVFQQRHPLVGLAANPAAGDKQLRRTSRSR